MSIFSLEGKNAIVTGPYGYLGTSISKGLKEFGADVIPIGRQECDVRDENAFRDYIEKYDKVDILINNAYKITNEPFESITKEEYREGMDGTLTHYVTCTQAIIPKMVNGSSIINIASIYGVLGIDERIYTPLGRKPPIHYSIAKGGIIQLTKHIATIYADKGIRCNSISPGFFPKKKEGVPDNPEYIKELTNRIPMRRIGKPDELIGAVVFLASDASSYVTGHNLIVDGGYSTW